MSCGCDPCNCGSGCDGYSGGSGALVDITYKPGQILCQGDLDIHFADANGNPCNVASISYDLYFVDPGPPETEVLIPPSPRTPVNPSLGSYYAALMIPPSAEPGTYRIRWYFQQAAGDPVSEVVHEFQVISPNVQVVTCGSAIAQEMVNKLRVLLRDHNPDKFYHFRPPEHEGRIGKYNRVFGQVWEDRELCEYLERALDWWNMYPPETEHLCTIDQLVMQKPAWREAIFWGAMIHALFALAINWAHDEFDYSIGGISLSINKSSLYESLKQNAEGRFDQLTEIKARTTKIIRGLQQPRFGRGIRSSFGPAVGRGVLSPRNFI